LRKERIPMRSQICFRTLTIFSFVLGLLVLCRTGAFAEDEVFESGSKTSVPPKAIVMVVPDEGEAPLQAVIMNLSTGHYDSCQIIISEKETLLINANFPCMGLKFKAYRFSSAATYFVSIVLMDTKAKIYDIEGVEVAVRAPDAPPGGAWGSKQSAMFSSPSDLELFRQYRDEFLKRTTRGKLYVDLLYENSEQALKVFEENPELTLKARTLIEANVEAVSQSLNGVRGEISSTEEIASFLKEFGEKSPATLKVLCNTIRRDMLKKHKQGKPFLGFKMN
jgi:hypothetical protein